MGWNDITAVPCSQTSGEQALNISAVAPLRVTKPMLGTSCGEILSAIRLVRRSSSAKGSATPTTVPSSSKPSTSALVRGSV